MLEKYSASLADMRRLADKLKTMKTKRSMIGALKISASNTGKEDKVEMFTFDASSHSAKRFCHHPRVMKRRDCFTIGGRLTC